MMKRLLVLLRGEVERLLGEAGLVGAGGGEVLGKSSAGTLEGGVRMEREGRLRRQGRLLCCAVAWEGGSGLRGVGSLGWKRHGLWEGRLMLEWLCGKQDLGGHKGHSGQRRGEGEGRLLLWLLPPLLCLRLLPLLLRLLPLYHMPGIASPVAAATVAAATAVLAAVEAGGEDGLRRGWGGVPICLMARGQVAQHHDGLGGREGGYDHVHPRQKRVGPLLAGQLGQGRCKGLLCFLARQVRRGLKRVRHGRSIKLVCLALNHGQQVGQP
mmetsp:Transcript_8121/g.20049  ORF Transcript_8121/g.20049 Transcript_8121/m.20049 type:complete len:268 (-) Transcript_8121:2924-3727(-)